MVCAAAESLEHSPESFKSVYVDKNLANLIPSGDNSTANTPVRSKMQAKKKNGAFNMVPDLAIVDDTSEFESAGASSMYDEAVEFITAYVFS